MIVCGGETCRRKFNEPVSLTLIEDIFFFQLIDVFGRVPSSADTDVGDRFTRQFLRGKLYRLVTDIVGILRDRTDEKPVRFTGVLNPVILIGTAVKPAEQNVFISIRIVRNFRINFIDDAFIGHENRRDAFVVQRLKGSLILTCVIRLCLKVDFNREPVRLRKSLDLLDKAVRSVEPVAVASCRITPT